MNSLITSLKHHSSLLLDLSKVVVLALRSNEMQLILDSLVSDVIERLDDALFAHF